MELNQNISLEFSNTKDVLLAKQGDKSAFERLIEHNNKSMYRIASSILKNHQDIEDAYQNTIIKCYNGLNSLKKEDYFKTWLIRILINECNKILKSRKRIIPMEDINFHGSDANSSINLELTNAINLLDECLRVVTILFYFVDMPQKQIAKTLSIPEGTVRSRLSRARNKLYEILKER